MIFHRYCQNGYFYIFKYYFIMIKQVVLYVTILLAGSVYAQKPFIGKLVYSIEISDTSLRQLFPSSTMTIYTNDTIVRVETKTEALGQQVLIHNLQKNKAYLLIETDRDKYAIQLPEKEDSKTKYTYQKAKGKKIISGLSSRKMLVSFPNVIPKMEFYYHKEISAKYVPGFEDFPGLLTDYYVVSKDGIYHHQLKELTTEPISRDLFGIPSDYKKISMSDFVDIMTGADKVIEN
jgi:hypothetical protein